jgi:hypothetical protein
MVAANLILSTAACQTKADRILARRTNANPAAWNPAGQMENA